MVVAAHDEGAVLGRTLGSLLADALPGELEVVVTANGCADDTATIARSVPGVRVVELPEAGKAAALNAAERVATAFPRVYLDGDIELSTQDVRALCDALSSARAGLDADPAGALKPAPLAVCPARRVEVRGRPWPVRAYVAVNSRLPAFRTGLFGRGVVVLSEAGRRRFDVFPEVVADDLFLDSLFAADERRQVGSVQVVVQAPRRTVDLVRRLERVRRGNRELRREVAPDARASRRLSWLSEVVAPHPWLAPAAAVYVVLTLWADLRSRRPAARGQWGQDRSTRTPIGEPR